MFISPKFLLILCLSLSVASVLDCGSAFSKDESNQIEIELTGTPSLTGESGEVLAALKNLFLGLAQRNVEQVGSCLSENVTMFEEHSHKVIFGKEAVLEHVKNNIIGTNATSPVKRMVVGDPFVDVKGDTAMVSYRAVKEMADTHHTKMESWCSEVFERKDGKWLILQFRSNWKTMPSHT